VDASFLDFDKNCVFNTEFKEGLEDLAQRNFDLDDLG
jgi:hypothetical protein